MLIGDRSNSELAANLAEMSGRLAAQTLDLATLEREMKVVSDEVSRRTQYSHPRDPRPAKSN